MPSAPNSASQNPLILVVDDHDHNTQLVCQILSAAFPCTFAIANNGWQALEIAQNKIPQLILLDIMMPGMDGYEVAAHLKQHPLTADIPFIFLTAKIEDEDIEKGFDLGAVDYIMKPFNRKVLLGIMKKLFTSGE